MNNKTKNIALMNNAIKLFWSGCRSYLQLFSLLTIDTNINLIIYSLLDSLIKIKKFYRKTLRKFVSFMLIYSSLYVILADIGNEHCSRYVLPLH